jgi:hypothetical protein
VLSVETATQGFGDVSQQFVNAVLAGRPYRREMRWKSRVMHARTSRAYRPGGAAQRHRSVLLAKLFVHCGRRHQPGPAPLWPLTGQLTAWCFSARRTAGGPPASSLTVLCAGSAIGGLNFAGHQSRRPVSPGLDFSGGATPDCWSARAGAFAWDGQSAGSRRERRLSMPARRHRKAPASVPMDRTAAQPCQAAFVVPQENQPVWSVQAIVS